MPRVLIALALLPLLAGGAPVPKHRPALGVFGGLCEPSTKCQFEVNGGNALTITLPADLPKAEPDEAGPIRLLASRAVEGDFVLTVKVAVTNGTYFSVTGE